MLLEAGSSTAESDLSEETERTIALFNAFVSLTRNIYDAKTRDL